ncbi:unnamed protein product [Cylindrotheca closterium]|uniref:Uncharacterized protein n=1 Tax=Cylindrotheca closterium TaxID=2856 RepID=A0AAD2CGL4_9STRA|nr:unnamed protein product [Cylindrotheca closterium]
MNSDDETLQSKDSNTGPEVDLDILPATAEEVFNLDPYSCWEGTIRTVLSGTRDKDSPLKILREHESTLVRFIRSYLTNEFASHLTLTFPSILVEEKDEDILARIESFQEYWRGYPNEYDAGGVAFMRLSSIEFPPPADRNVNMLPFIFGSQDSLPRDLQCYYPLVAKCPFNKDEIGQVGYLTVHESFVDATKAQRREGLHIETPGIFRSAKRAAKFIPGQETSWGWGRYSPNRYDGGICMASSVSNTSKVWDALVDKKCPNIVDKHGGCEHLRSLIGKGTKLKAGELIWMTDCTPHEALCQETSGYRQFFRVVSSYVSHWYEDHSTRNPKVDLPARVKVIKGNKFEE